MAKGLLSSLVMPIPSIEISAVKGRRDLDRFVVLPWKIYRGDPSWVPPLIGDTKEMLRSRTSTPSSGTPRSSSSWRAEEGEPVGRIAAIVNHRHNEFHGEKTAFFGFFETIDDAAVSGALLEAAAPLGRGPRDGPPARSGQLLHERGVRPPRRRLRFATRRDDAVQSSVLRHPDRGGRLR